MIIQDQIRFGKQPVSKKNTYGSSQLHLPRPQHRNHLNHCNHQPSVVVKRWLDLEECSFELRFLQEVLALAFMKEDNYISMAVGYNFHYLLQYETFLTIYFKQDLCWYQFISRKSKPERMSINIYHQSNFQGPLENSFST